MLVIIEPSGSITLTASSLPPSPTSRIKTSISAFENISNAASVPNSKYVSNSSDLILSIFSKALTIFQSDTGFEFIFILSLYLWRCGEVYDPTETP